LILMGMIQGVDLILTLFRRIACNKIGLGE
jgi:hypothetical protein